MASLANRLMRSSSRVSTIFDDRFQFGSKEITDLWDSCATRLGRGRIGGEEGPAIALGICPEVEVGEDMLVGDMGTGLREGDE